MNNYLDQMKELQNLWKTKPTVISTVDGAFGIVL